MAEVGYRAHGDWKAIAGGTSIRADVDRTFARLERRTERALAAIRLLAFSILALVFGVVSTAEHGQPTMVPLTGLVAITLVTLVLANARVLPLWLLWLFATLDVAMLSHCLVMLADANGESLQLALESPVALLIFVFLAAAAVRHRPVLVLYTGGIFIAAWGQSGCGGTREPALGCPVPSRPTWRV